MYQQQLELELENTRRRRTDLELTNKKEDGELVGSICGLTPRVCHQTMPPSVYSLRPFFFFFSYSLIPYLTHTVGPETTSILHISCTQGTDGKKERKKENGYTKQGR